jgi:hypothetical protein
MPRRRRLSKQIAVDDAQYLDLHFGGWPNAFASPFLRRAAYYRVREQLLAECSAGQRPWAWWEYDAPEQPRPIGKTHILQGRPVTFSEDRTDCLDRLGLLEPWERADLAAIAAITGGATNDDFQDQEREAIWRGR